MSASLIGPSGSSTFRPSTYAVSMSLAGSCFSPESAPVVYLICLPYTRAREIFLNYPPCYFCATLP